MPRLPSIVAPFRVALLVIAFAARIACADASGDVDEHDVLDSDSLAEAFEITPPITVFDNGGKSGSRAELGSRAIRFRIAATPALLAAAARGGQTVSFPEVKAPGAKQANACWLEIRRPVKRLKGETLDFDVREATWNMGVLNVVLGRPAGSAPVKRACYDFAAFDRSGVFRVSCQIPDCDLKVADFRKLFGSTEAELVEVNARPGAENVDAGAEPVGSTVRFEQAEHSTTPPSKSREPAAATAPVSILPPVPAGAAAAVSASGASAGAAPSPDVVPGGATVMTRGSQ